VLDVPLHLFGRIIYSTYRMLSAKMEDYLKAIYALAQDEGEPVSTSSIAEYLGVTPPTATSMMGNLAERGLVVHEKYSGVELTPEGETVALEVLRHHRLLETYLAEQLGYDWSEVHDEADRLEHHISEEFERRVANQLDDPDVDPHGDPIPNDALEPLEDEPGTALADHGEDDRLIVRRVSDRNAEELAYLEREGLTPGTELRVAEIAPIGVVTVELEDGTTVSLPDEVTTSIRVERRPTQEA
jgi:DtxR family Mn-dependent transcriptional regulator